jgi:Domain of unknown function (DUF4279)
MLSDYDDDYPTCAKTYATFRIYHTDLNPDQITSLLEIQPTGTQVNGRPMTNSIGIIKTPSIGGWFLSTEGLLDSKDVRRHVDWILDKLASRERILKLLQAEGNRLDVFCYWLSAEGHGGPILSPATLRRLGELDLEIGFDIYG